MAHRVAKGLVGGCALLLGVTLSGCAAPQFTYVANSGASTYFKVPNGWHKISDSALSYDVLRDIFLPVTSNGRQNAAAQGFPFTDFKQIRDQTLTLSQGVHGVRETFDYSYAGGTDTWDEIALTNADQTVVYLLVLHCTTSCYGNDQTDISNVMSSFTIRSS